MDLATKRDSIYKFDVHGYLKSFNCRYHAVDKHLNLINPFIWIAWSFMNNNFKSTDNQEFHLDQDKKSTDYQYLLERFKSIKKCIALLEKMLNK